MSYSEIVREISRLPADQQIQLHDALSKLVIERKKNNKTKLSAAAHALLQDYKEDTNLTEFTVLDADDFHAAR